ncbi:hypothetical protein RIF29_38606 [Crotalaria pallida]|uniref:TF-B3 domain-containing protein n=1 Tax=Crotalaria pallida TaxID=3830 RepID=A0AAN9HNX4_CROPI
MTPALVSIATRATVSGYRKSASYKDSMAFNISGLGIDEAIVEVESEEFQNTNVYDPIIKDLDGTELPIPAHVRDENLTIGQEYVMVKARGTEPEKWFIIWNPIRNNACAFGEGWYGYVQSNHLKVDDMVEFYKNENTGVWIAAYLKSGN